ncbi:MAG: Malate dehydrogenase (oxaloacetate-decarboxylating) [Ilumatobacteraceae bacterium]|nr:Malate dehydrogenase (oxaloacetate-decarboxylating) [Ilumatobacteraceae bacterium]
MKNITTTGDRPSPEPATLPTQPSAGFALRLDIAVDGAAGAADLVRAVFATGADIRSMETAADGTRSMTVACADLAQQDAVRAAVGTSPGARARSLVDATFELHRGGKIAVTPRAEVRNADELAMAYTPGVGRVSAAIAVDDSLSWTYTGRSNAVAVLSDGSAVLGLGNIGPKAAMPVMEGKAVLFKQFAGIDAYPLCIDATSVDEIVAVAKAIAPSFGGINLEDIAAPMCFEVEERLQAELDIPVFHDDQHGTAIVVLAALQNAAKAVGKSLAEMTVVIVGTGAAGLACGKLLRSVGVVDLIGVDREGILHESVLDEHSSCAKWWFATEANRDRRTGTIAEALKGADALVGLSGPGVIEAQWLEHMADDAIVCAMANPIPEVMPEQVPANVAVMATGRSDYPNQINNVLAFPGVFRGMLDVRATMCTESMKLAAAAALAAMVPSPTTTRILPSVFDPGVAEAVAGAVAAAATAAGCIRR